MNVPSGFTVTKRLFSATWTSVIRNKLLSFATIIVITLIAFFLNILSSINYLANYSIESINRKIDLTLEIKDGIELDDPAVDRLKAELIQSNAQVVLISKEQALQDFKQYLPDLGNFLEKYSQNPLPASLYITAPNLEVYEQISAVVENPQYKKIINFDQNENSFLNQKIRITKIVDMSVAAKNFVLILQVAFFLIAILIVLNTIQIVVHHRREEIRIMKLVGASKAFITGPFVLEGVLYGILGGVLGFSMYYGLVNVAYYNVNQLLPSAYIRGFMTSLWQYYTNQMGSILVQQLLTFIIIGVASSMIAVWRFVPLLTMPGDFLNFSTSRKSPPPEKT